LPRDVKTRWPDEVRRCRLAAENSDGWCIDRFLGFFGGMGSLNDYYIQRENGPDINATDKLNSLFRGMDVSSCFEESWIEHYGYYAFLRQD
jgi:hypothetical protein